MTPDMAEAVAMVSHMTRRGHAAALELIHTAIPARGERPADWRR